MGEFLEIAKVMVEPGMKLLEMFGSAVGMVYEPRHIRKLADAEAYKIKTLGAAMSETDSLPIEYDAGSLSMSTADYEDLARRAAARTKYQLIQEQLNMESVVWKAYQTLEGAPVVTNEPQDQDWITRYFGIVRDISTEEMQNIWSKILAGEITNPGSFSMRTLETIRNMSKKEATTFQKIVPFLIDGGGDFFVTSKATIHDKYGVTYEDMMLLDECGLILSNGTVSMTISVDADSTIAHNGEYCLLAKGITKKTDITFGVYSLTTPGRELLQIIERVPNKEYFLDFAEHVFKENKLVNLEVQTVDTVKGHKVRTTGEIVREFCRKQGTVSTL